ncbi:Hsp20/alpha crystallin family protein [Lacrimispora amygdalina]|uniref:Hsp20/alpha crystallin family protein n=1 Tax=Lacrimispora amygdalina TaxID=253257 RepID=UPI000BE24497|nr:Hsp20/alpha crystallin family protein [Lacrimispora amygdalina]
MTLFSPKKGSLGFDENINSTITLDMLEDDYYYYIFAEFPGREKKDIKIKFKGDKLSLKISEDIEEDLNQNYIISERCHTERERLIELEDPVNKKEVQANFQNGLLEISIKKMDPDENDEEDLIQIS